MNDLPRQTLCEMIAKYGDSLCDEPLRCEGLLRDLCPGNRREVNVLINALRERVPTDILTSSTSIPIELSLARLSKRLQDNQGVTEEMARWAVESWALGLGRISEKQLTKRKDQTVHKESPQYPRQKSPSKQSSKPPKVPLPSPIPKKKSSSGPLRRGPKQAAKGAKSTLTISPQRRDLVLLLGLVFLIFVGIIVVAIVQKQRQASVPAATPLETPSPVPTTSGTVLVSATPIPAVASTQTPMPTAAETPTPTQAPPVTPPLPVASDYEAQAFVNSFYRALERKDLDYLLSQYGDSVDYLTDGRRDKAFIRNDYLKYFNRWPVTSFTIGDIRIFNSVSENSATLSFDVQFSVGDPSSKRSKTGRASQNWTLTKLDGAFRIISQRETVFAGASPPAPAGDEEGVRQFIRNYYSDLSRRDIDAVLSRFDSTVNYQGSGNRGKNYIRADVYKYLNKWNQLNFDLGPIDVSQSGDGRLVASFTFSYTVTNSYGRKSGRSSNVWTLRNVNGSLLITSQQESVQRN